MFAPGHWVLAAAGWVTISAHAGAEPWQVAAGAIPAAAAAAGPTSPDIDNAPLWKRLDKWVPDEWLGDGGPLGHRELMHWWGIPAIAAAYAHTLPTTPWWVWAAIVGWASHIVGDFVFGQAGHGTQRGVPLGPWWWHVGIGIKCGGVTERAAGPAVAAAAAWWVAGHPTTLADLTALLNLVRPSA